MTTRGGREAGLSKVLVDSIPKRQQLRPPRLYSTSTLAVIAALSLKRCRRVAAQRLNPV